MMPLRWLYIIVLGFLSTNLGFGLSVRLSAQDIASMQALLAAQRYVLLNKPVQVTQALDKALDIDPNNDAAYYKYAQWHQAQSHYLAALEAIEQALALDKHNKHYHQARLDIALAQKDKLYALDAYAALFDALPKHLPSYAQAWAQVCISQSAYERAEEIATALEAQTGYTPLVAALRVRVRKAQAISPAQTQALQEALRTRASAFPTPNYVMDYVQTLDSAVAVAWLSDLYQQNPQRVYALYLGQYYLRYAPEQALDFLLPLIETQALSVLDQLDMLALCLTQATSKVHKGACLQLTQAACQAQAQEASLQAMGAQIARHHQDFDQAYRRYQTAQSLGDNRFIVWEGLVAMAYKQQDFDQTRLKEALSYYPYQFIFYFYAAEASREAQDFDQAAQQYAQAIELGGNTAVLFKGYAQTLQALGEEKKAQDMYKKAATHEND